MLLDAQKPEVAGNHCLTSKLLQGTDELYGYRPRTRDRTMNLELACDDFAASLIF